MADDSFEYVRKKPFFFKFSSSESTRRDERLSRAIILSGQTMSKSFRQDNIKIEGGYLIENKNIKQRFNFPKGRKYL